jgi:hypothetical protein
MALFLQAPLAAAARSAPPLGRGAEPAAAATLSSALAEEFTPLYETITSRWHEKATCFIETDGTVPCYSIIHQLKRILRIAHRL